MLFHLIHCFCCPKECPGIHPLLCHLQLSCVPSCILFLFAQLYCVLVCNPVVFFAIIGSPLSKVKKIFQRVFDVPLKSFSNGTQCVFGCLVLRKFQIFSEFVSISEVLDGCFC